MRYADVSLNSELNTIRWISEEAVKQNKSHKIIIMVETGDLREGVMGDHLLDFYAKVFDLPNLEIIGLGTNLNCLNGVLPSADKLIQLSLYKQIIELKFNKRYLGCPQVLPSPFLLCYANNYLKELTILELERPFILEWIWWRKND